jgi:glycosyltransferase involved in cell wall biosynthesis
MPEISIITPSMNSAGVIGQCISSVAEQVVPVEHLVIDGNSSDETLDTIKRTGADIRVIQQPPRGIYPAINAGISAGSGNIVGILHADDFYADPGVLEQVVSVFDDPDVDACYGDLCYIDASNPSQTVRYWRAGEYKLSSFRNGWMPPHPTFFVRRKVYEKHGLYRTDLGTAADYEMMVRLLVKHRVSAVYIPEVLVHMRTGGASNASLQARIEANRMDRQAWKINGLRPYPWMTIAKPLRKLGQWWNRP